MAATSIHIKACDVSASETHNRREKELDYVRQDLSHLNESFSYIPHSLPSELNNIKREVKAKTGRALYKNAVPIKEGVIVIDKKTTMANLQMFCDKCQKQFGIIPLQIHIHRDEGHSRSTIWKPNLHAHIVWRMYDANGKNIRLSKDSCSEMQTLAAECLGMQRGKSSDKKHLSSLQFKVEKEQKRLSEVKNEISKENIRLEALKAENGRFLEQMRVFEDWCGKELPPTPPIEAPAKDWENYILAHSDAPDCIPIEDIRIIQSPANTSIEASVMGESCRASFPKSVAGMVSRQTLSRRQVVIAAFRNKILEWTIKIKTGMHNFLQNSAKNGLKI